MERRQRRSFSEEFKARTVELIESSGKSIPEVCRELDLTETAVRRWVDAGAHRRRPGPGLTSAEREELTRLRRENRILREVREILKRSALGSARHGNTSVLMNVEAGRGGTGTAGLPRRAALRSAALRCSALAARFAPPGPGVRGSRWYDRRP
jgi:transposase